MYCRDTDVPYQSNKSTPREKVACSPLSGRHGAPPVQELHLSLPPTQKEDHPGLHKNSMPVSCKPYTPYHWSINPVAFPQLRHADGLSQRCAANFARSVHRVRPLAGVAKGSCICGRCFRLLTKGNAVCMCRETAFPAILSLWDRSYCGDISAHLCVRGM